MSLFQRLSATFSASMENLVDRVENHDAVVEASIRKCRQAAAETRVRLARLQKDGRQMQARMQKLESDIELWQQRALDTADADENKALKCLKRKKELKTELRQIEGLFSSHSQCEEQVKSNLQQIENRIGEISQQRNAMRSRECAVRAMRILDQMEGNTATCLEDAFDRWESSLLQTEMASAAHSTLDQLDDEFLQQEEQLALRGELEILRSAREGSNDE